MVDVVGGHKIGEERRSCVSQICVEFGRIYNRWLGPCVRAAAGGRLARTRVLYPFRQFRLSEGTECNVSFNNGVASISTYDVLSQKVCCSCSTIITSILIISSWYFPTSTLNIQVNLS